MPGSTLEGERQIPWIFTSAWSRKSAAVMRRAILPVKPAIAIVVAVGGIVMFEG